LFLLSTLSGLGRGQEAQTVNWLSFDEGLRLAKAEGRPLFLFIGGEGCPECPQYESEVILGEDLLSDRWVTAKALKMSQYEIIGSLQVSPEDIKRFPLPEQFKSIELPAVVMIAISGEVCGPYVGPLTRDQLYWTASAVEDWSLLNKETRKKLTRHPYSVDEVAQTSKGIKQLGSPLLGAPFGGPLVHSDTSSTKQQPLTSIFGGAQSGEVKISGAGGQLDELAAAVAAHPDDSDSRWKIANLLEYQGRYREALTHYRWIAGDSAQVGISDKRRREAKLHLATCEFLEQAATKGKASSANKGVSEQVASGQVVPKGNPESNIVQSVFPESAQEYSTDRPEWGYLEHLVAAVAVAGGVTLAGGNDSEIQSALSYLCYWQSSPLTDDAELRNRIVAGIVSYLVSEISGKQLRPRVDSLMSEAGYETVEVLPQDMPESPEASAMEQEFKTTPAPSQHAYEIGGRLRVIEVSSGNSISGTYQYGVDTSYVNMGVGQVNRTATTLTVDGTEIRFSKSTTMYWPGGPMLNSSAFGQVIKVSNTAFTSRILEMGTGRLVNGVADVTWVTTTDTEAHIWEEVSGDKTTRKNVPASTDRREGPHFTITDIHLTESGDLQVTGKYNGVSSTTIWKRR